jgi:hypothetical protein
MHDFLIMAVFDEGLLPPFLFIKIKFSAEEANDSPIFEQVRLTVPITDEPTLSCLTFRTWVLGITSCALLAFASQFFAYSQNRLPVTSVSAQINVQEMMLYMAN